MSDNSEMTALDVAILSSVQVQVEIGYLKRATRQVKEAQAAEELARTQLLMAIDDARKELLANHEFINATISSILPQEPAPDGENPGTVLPEPAS